MSWLLTDPIAVEHWAAGLADRRRNWNYCWGISRFEHCWMVATEVALDGQGTDGGQSFQIVKIMRGPARYRLWISATTSLLRRLELLPPLYHRPCCPTVAFGHSLEY